MQTQTELEQLLAPIAGDAPSGVDLHHDPEFDLLRTALTPAFDYPKLDGREIRVPRPREFGKIRQGAVALLKRGRDLRVLVGLVEALTATEGPSGLAAGLALVRKSLVLHWDTLYPELDPDEPENPAARRLNALRDLTAGDRLPAELRRMRLAEAPGLGSVSLRDWDLASGQVAPLPHEKKPDASALNAVLKAMPAGVLAEQDAALAAAEAELAAIVQLLAGKLPDPTAAPDFAPLSEAISKLRALLGAHAPAGSDASGPAVAATAGGAAMAVARQPTAAAWPVRLDGRDEVLRALDLAIEYYRRCEPGSPVPFLLERARRLVPMTFLEAMADLAPAEATKQIRAALGAKE